MNWLAIFLSALGNLACHHIAPVVFRVLWRNHIVQYNRLPTRKKADFDMRLGEIVLGCICVFVVVQAVLYEKELGSLGIVGSTYLGNVALGITIGQFVTDIVYFVFVRGCKLEWVDVFHHGATISGALLTQRYFHVFALYRYIHELTLPLIGIFAQMRALRFDPKRPIYKVVAVSNLFVFVTLRLLVVPFHSIWMMWTVWTATDKMEVPLFVWIFSISANISIDYVNILWAVMVIKAVRGNWNRDW